MLYLENCIISILFKYSYHIILQMDDGLNCWPCLLKWDCLVLTARNKAQCGIFQEQLDQLKLVERGFCSEYLVLADMPESIRIGSGGATLNAFLILAQRFGSDYLKKSRVLLLHSGGLSQRIPHVALTGKAFMLMPNGQTLLEHKLNAYKILLGSLSCTQFNGNGFVFIVSADVLEHFPANFHLPMNASSSIATQLLLVSHDSPLEVATQHGVFVLSASEGEGGGANQNQLYCVLQKPTEAMLISQIPDAILPANSTNSVQMALTDSCYLIGHKLVEQLLELRRENGEIHCELCCYRDFLCPLGTAEDEKKQSHFCQNNPELLKWQKIMWDQMHFQETQMLRLGPDSFFHFGTATELLNHFLNPNSAFRKKFLWDEGRQQISNMVNCWVRQPEKISSESFLEWCYFDAEVDYRIEADCILSGLHLELEEEATKSAQPIHIGTGICACTIPIVVQESGGLLHYVTLMFHRDDDLKRIVGLNGEIEWVGHQIHQQTYGREFTSLWDCPLFEAQPTATQSLLSTLTLLENGPAAANRKRSANLLSISEIFAKADVHQLLEQRKQLKSLMDSRGK